MCSFPDDTVLYLREVCSSLDDTLDTLSNRRLEHDRKIFFGDLIIM